MASSFAVTTTTNSLRLENGRRGEAVFTIFNASGRPLRGRARLAADPPAAQAWLSLAGEPERDFTIAGTQQYSVRVQIPPQAPPGTYTFRLDMIGVDNPDEDYTQGPAVSFEVPAAAPAKRFPWWLILIPLALVLLIGGGVAGYFLTRTVQIPELAGLTISEATARLTDAGLEVGETQLVTDDTVPENRVIRSEPPTGSSIRPGRPVNLIISAGPVRVTLPDVDDRLEADGRRILESSCDAPPCVIVQTLTEASSSVESGRIIRTDPTHGTLVARGSTVTMVVSIGPATFSREFIASADRYWDPPNTLYIIGQVPDFGHGPRLGLWNSSTLGGNGLAAIYFNLGELPSGATVERAELELNLQRADGAGAQITISQATTAWSEDTFDHPTCSPVQSTAQEVGLGSGPYRWDVTALVQAQYANPDAFTGFCLQINGDGLQRVFDSREGVSTQQPKLVVNYRR